MRDGEGRRDWEGRKKKERSGNESKKVENLKSSIESQKSVKLKEINVGTFAISIKQKYNFLVNLEWKKEFFNEEGNSNSNLLP